MNAPLPLRLRFGLLALLLGLALSGLASLELLDAAEDYEYIVSNEILRGQAEDYGRSLASGAPDSLPHTQRLRGYRIGDPELPRSYAALPPGITEDPDDGNTHVGVFDTAAGRLVFVIDLGDIEGKERQLRRLMAVLVVLGTALSGWLGWLLAGLALKPVRTLAEGVEALAVQPQATHLAAGVSHDDLGRLARAIDGYQMRLVEADSNEQAFLADASHELRTPLTVIQGALEVLQDDASATPAQRKRLDRVDRGVVEMRRLLEAMLAAARRKPLQIESVRGADLLRDVADAALEGRRDVVCASIVDRELRIDSREALLLLAGLLRRLAQQQPTGELQLALHADRIVMRVFAAQDSEQSCVAPRADTGTGSALLDRLAARLGWQVAIDSATQISIRTDAIPSSP